MDLSLSEMNIIALWRQGAQAVKTIPGLKKRVLICFAFNLILLLVTVAICQLLFFFFINKPLTALLESHAPAWLAVILQVSLTLVQIGLFFVFMILAVRISLKLMVFWYENLVEKVVGHFRNLPETPFSLKRELKNLTLTAFSVAKELALMAGLFIIGLTPVIGPLIVFTVGSHLLGRGILDPYLEVLKASGQPLDLGKLKHQPSLSTLSLGWAQMLIAVLPVIGWLVLPVSVIYQVLGLAFCLESKRHNHNTVAA